VTDGRGDYESNKTIDDIGAKEVHVAYSAKCREAVCSRKKRRPSASPKNGGYPVAVRIPGEHG
jgi:hypothetical protein